jgi:lysozyme family protein
MKSNFDACLKEVLHHEGGYVNHPKVAIKYKHCYVALW